MRRYGRFGRHDDRQVLTKARLREMHAGSRALRLPDETRRKRSHTARRPENASSSASAASVSSSSSEAPTAAEGMGSLLIGAVHGIPASHSQGLRKVARDDYFGAVRSACTVPHLDVLVTHSNPKLAGQAEVRGEDAPRLHEAFMRSGARLHVHGHMHTEPAISVVEPGRVVVNADCRVVLFVPP